MVMTGSSWGRESELAVAGGFQAWSCPLTLPFELADSHQRGKVLALFSREELARPPLQTRRRIGLTMPARLLSSASGSWERNQLRISGVRAIWIFPMVQRSVEHGLRHSF